ncbi:MAG: hypothetical protein AAF942_03740 [Pseudomonadota bacterium]
MNTKPRNIALVAAFVAGLGPYVVTSAHAADWYQPGNPAQQEIERGEANYDFSERDLYGSD